MEGLKEFAAPIGLPVSEQFVLATIRSGGDPSDADGEEHHNETHQHDAGDLDVTHEANSKKALISSHCWRVVSRPL